MVFEGYSVGPEEDVMQNVVSSFEIPPKNMEPLIPPVDGEPGFRSRSSQRDHTERDLLEKHQLLLLTLLSESPEFILVLLALKS